MSKTRHQTFIFGLIAIAVAIALVAVAQEGVPIDVLIARAHARLAERRSFAARQHGRRQRGNSRVRLARRHSRRRQHRTTTRQRVVSSPRPPRSRLVNVTVKVRDKAGRPVPYTSFAATIYPKTGADIARQEKTDPNGNLLFKSVGPLPAALELDVASPRWRLADAESSSLYIEPTDAEMYYGTAHVQPAVVQVSVHAPAGSTVSSAALTPLTDTGVKDEDDQEESPDEAAKEAADAKEIEVAVPEAQQAECQLPAENLEDEAVPIVVSKEVPGGTTESIIRSYDVTAEQETVNAPALQLASLRSVEIACGVSVLNRVEDVTKLLGKRPRGDNNLIRMADGSEWWVYPNHGLAAKLRTLPVGGRNEQIVERIRLLGPSGGKVSGVGVGSSTADVYAALGTPQVKDDPSRIASDIYAPRGSIDTYLDGGLRFCQADGKVLWIDIARSTAMLLQGSSTLEPRARARLFVRQFQGHPRLNLQNQQSLEHYLSQLPSVQLVHSEDSADLILDARVTDFNENRGEFFGSLIPYEYSCKTTLQYSLWDVSKQKYIVQDQLLSSSARANFRNEIYKAIILGIIAHKLPGGAGKYGPWVIAAATLYDLKRKMQKAANRCPGISERQVFSSLLNNINEAVDFIAPVSQIDYARGLVTINAGSEDGVYVGTPDKPFEFELSVADQPLIKRSEEGQSADYYTAVVQSVSAHACECELRHVDGKVKSDSYVIPSQPAPDMVKRLPDPQTQVLTARAWVNFPPVTVISDADIQKDDEEDQRRRQELPPAGSPPAQDSQVGDTQASGSNNGKKKGGSLRDILNQILTPKPSQ